MLVNAPLVPLLSASITVKIETAALGREVTVTGLEQETRLSLLLCLCENTQPLTHTSPTATTPPCGCSQTWQESVRLLDLRQRY